ncbi:unnamed protein product [Ambrosiozyma monospora]|uniref:Unnamed protein product n=1 Tax=Ambrosiozyma monospora TaxID=43982 RepID=A0A9W6Z8X1_AMBMO|nr:unnamed protein product [Ambrosiozyma monospora]
MSIIPDFTKLEIPTLKPVLFFHIEANEPEMAMANKQSNLTHVPITGGFVKSLDSKLPFDYEILHGSDDITSFADSPVVGHLDCKLFLKSKSKSKDSNGKDGDKKAFVYYTGVVRFEDAVNGVIGKTTDTMDFEDGYVTCHPIFTVESEDEKWVKEINFLGKGRFVRDANGKLCVQYYVYTFA